MPLHADKQFQFFAVAVMEIQSLSGLLSELQWHPAEICVAAAAATQQTLTFCAHSAQN